jgi:hypothetical protein
MEPKLHCETCFCIKCKVEAAKSKYWTYHCTAAVREVKKETVEIKRIKKGREKKVKVTEKKADKMEKSGPSKKEAALLASSKKDKAIKQIQTYWSKKGATQNIGDIAGEKVTKKAAMPQKKRISCIGIIEK